MRGNDSISDWRIQAMTRQEQEEIIRLRDRGRTYAEIAETTGIPVSTLKSFFRRNVRKKEALPVAPDADHCRECGKELVQNPKVKRRIFCSRSCREKWWKEHADTINRKAVYSFTCPCCGAPFTAYGNAHRKYCSHACYIRHRFGGGSHE